MPYVLMWPQATEYFNKYNSIVSQLSNLKAQINKAAETNLYSVRDFTNEYLYGEYYEEYVDKVNEWCKEANLIKSEFERIDSELESRIEKAKRLRDLWESRINLKRWVDTKK